ncbi:unnamed protein product [Echinostoma caproni]|uniref:Uncharacterized protein n=1 Tax=Echinostoma caproni TaxID=27848 RepID=A0A183B5N8_9TREM|nr:unnamed protein product [Echinostoma caproni]
MQPDLGKVEEVRVIRDREVAVLVVLACSTCSVLTRTTHLQTLPLLAIHPQVVPWLIWVSDRLKMTR